MGAAVSERISDRSVVNMVPSAGRVTWVLLVVGLGAAGLASARQVQTDVEVFGDTEKDQVSHRFLKKE